MEDPKEKLQAEATALGVDVDGRWGEARLGQEIEAARKREAEKEEEGEAYGDGTDDAGEHSGEDDARAEEGHEPADNRAGDAAGDVGAGGGREGDGVDGEEIPASAGGADVPAGGDAGGPAADGDAPPEPEEHADRADDHAARGDGGSDPAASDDGAGEPAGADGDPAAQGLEDVAAGDGDASDRASDAGGGEEGESNGHAVADPGDGSADGVAPAADAVQPDPFGGLPPDPVEPDDAAMREAYLTARLAMTGPMVAAFNAACAVAGGSGGPAWFAGEADIGSYVPALVNEAVPFVRQWPAAPTEALYEHVRRAVTRLGHVEPFDELPLQHRIAWDVFRTVLVQVDAAIEQETRRREAEAAAAAERGWGQRDIDPDDTLYAPATSREQRSDLGRAREGSGALRG